MWQVIDGCCIGAGIVGESMTAALCLHISWRCFKDVRMYIVGNVIWVRSLTQTVNTYLVMKFVMRLRMNFFVKSFDFVNLMQEFYFKI